MVKPEILHFQRFEFKYILPRGIIDDVRGALARYMTHDSYAADSQDKFYEVWSLYYDSPGFFYYHQKMDGVMCRKKVRLRTYRQDGQMAERSFLEIKRKRSAVILKDRCHLSREESAELIATGSIPDAVPCEPSLREEFDRERMGRSIEPKLLVVYDREPLIGKFNPNVRITFDSHLRVCEADALSFAQNGFSFIDGGFVIMEVKFTGTLPRYIKEIIQTLALERTDFSKYCRGIERVGSASIWERPYRAYHNDLSGYVSSLSRLYEGVS